MPDSPGLELIAHELDAASAGSVLGTYHERGQACLIVEPKAILDVLGWLRDTPGQEYRFLASLHGVDYLPASPRFGVVYELLNMPRVERLRVPPHSTIPVKTNCRRSTAAYLCFRPRTIRSARCTTSSGLPFVAIPTFAGS